MNTTVKIRSLYHNPKGERGIGKVIVAWTWFLGLFYNWKILKYNFSHEELHIPRFDFKISKNRFESVFQEYDNLFKRITPIGKCFSSTTRGLSNGVRFLPAGNVLQHPERWSYIEYEVDLVKLEVAIAKANRLVGSKYDFLALFGFLNPIPIQDSKRWYCSEICAWFKRLLGVNKKKYKRLSPRRSAYLMAKKYGEPKPLIWKK